LLFGKILVPSYVVVPPGSRNPGGCLRFEQELENVTQYTFLVRRQAEETSNLWTCRVRTLKTGEHLGQVRFHSLCAEILLAFSLLS
jgi:hypothetical protein